MVHNKTNTTIKSLMLRTRTVTTKTNKTNVTNVKNKCNKCKTKCYKLQNVYNCIKIAMLQTTYQISISLISYGIYLTLQITKYTKSDIYKGVNGLKWNRN